MRAPARAPGGADLREARTKAGLSLEDAAQKTRIPQRYLEALERGDTGVFPPGPFLSGYTRQYRAYLGLPDAPAVVKPSVDPEPTATMTTQSLLRQSRGRMFALIGGLVTAIALGALVASRAEGEPDAQVGQQPDQTVLVGVAEPVRAQVTADGRNVWSGALTPGAQRRFEAHDRLEIELATLDGVTLHYNGRVLKPLGGQSHSRRLVFIDDSSR